MNEKIYLHAETIDGKIVISDQNGRVVGGVVKSAFFREIESISTIELTVYAHDANGKPIK